MPLRYLPSYRTFLPKAAFQNHIRIAIPDPNFIPPVILHSRPFSTSSSLPTVPTHLQAVKLLNYRTGIFILFFSLKGNGSRAGPPGAADPYRSGSKTSPCPNSWNIVSQLRFTLAKKVLLVLKPKKKLRIVPVPYLMVRYLTSLKFARLYLLIFDNLNIEGTGSRRQGENFITLRYGT